MTHFKSNARLLIISIPCNFFKNHHGSPLLSVHDPSIIVRQHDQGASSLITSYSWSAMSFCQVTVKQMYLSWVHTYPWMNQSFHNSGIKYRQIDSPNDVVFHWSSVWLSMTVKKRGTCCTVLELEIHWKSRIWKLWSFSIILGQINTPVFLHFLSLSWCESLTWIFRSIFTKRKTAISQIDFLLGMIHGTET